jgi:hypothetical protein
MASSSGESCDGKHSSSPLGLEFAGGEKCEPSLEETSKELEVQATHIQAINRLNLIMHKNHKVGSSLTLLEHPYSNFSSHGIYFEFFISI